jgi:hypothetical protein
MVAWLHGGMGAWLHGGMVAGYLGVALNGGNLIVY